jgi:hypothetical protein
MAVALMMLESTDLIFDRPRPGARNRIASLKVPLILFTLRKFLEGVENDRVYRCEMALVARENR